MQTKASAPASTKSQPKVVMATPVPASTKPAPNVPTAAPIVADPVPDLEPAPPAPAPVNSAPSPEPRVRRTARGFNWLRLIVILFGVGFVGCIAILAIALIVLLSYNVVPFKGTDSTDEPEGVVHIVTSRDAKGANEKVYKLILPKADWAVDNEILKRFGALTAFKHTQQDFWFAVVVKDYGMHKPRDAEMLAHAIDQLENHYKDSMELAAKAEPVKVGSSSLRVPGQKLQFKGQVNAANWLGECYIFFHDGIGYWMFMASPEWENVERFSGMLTEKNFSVLSDRRGWREQPPPTESFTSLNGKVTLTVPKKVWESNNAKNEDENGELFLFGKYQKEKDNRKNASLLIFTMPAKADLKEAMAAAREYRDGKVKADNEHYKLIHAPDVAPGQPDTGTIEELGDRRGKLVDLKLQFNDEPKRYQLLAVINEPEIVYVIVCDCTWESRQIWRQEFIEVLRTLRVKKE